MFFAILWPRALIRFLPIDRLAKLMGHKDIRMLVTLYDHSGDDAEHMRGLLKRAS